MMYVIFLYCLQLKQYMKVLENKMFTLLYHKYTSCLIHIDIDSEWISNFYGILPCKLNIYFNI